MRKLHPVCSHHLVNGYCRPNQPRLGQAARFYKKLRRRRQTRRQRTTSYFGRPSWRMAVIAPFDFEIAIQEAESVERPAAQCKYSLTSVSDIASNKQRFPGVPALAWNEKLHNGHGSPKPFKPD